jgi:hypothetical protein
MTCLMMCSIYTTLLSFLSSSISSLMFSTVRHALHAVARPASLGFTDQSLCVYVCWIIMLLFNSWQAVEACLLVMTHVAKEVRQLLLVPYAVRYSLYICFLMLHNFSARSKHAVQCTCAQ